MTSMAEFRLANSCFFSFSKAFDAEFLVCPLTRELLRLSPREVVEVEVLSFDGGLGIKTGLLIVWLI